MKYILIFLILIISSCSKPKSAFVCGDHKCVNRSEAKQYFEENLTIELQILSKGKESSFDLVQLNTENKSKTIGVYKKKEKKKIKELSNEEIKAKKKELKQKKKLTKKIKKNQNLEDKKNIKLIKANNNYDICKELKKCDIDSITDHLIKVSNNKDYPNISYRN